MSTQDLQSKAQALHELKAFADELAGEIAAIESEIKAEMNVRQVDEDDGGDVQNPLETGREQSV